MAYLLEKANGSRCVLEAVKVEPFTQKQFADMIKEAHSRTQDYYLARVQCKSSSEDGKNIYYCYDARQLCKYIFEMVISTEGRKIRIKNFKDPINQEQIHEISFFKLRYDSDTPLRAEYVGNQANFLENNCFRSKIFYQENALDALSVNFQFGPQKKRIPIINKRKIFTVFVMVVVILVIGTLVAMIAEKESSRPPSPFKLPIGKGKSI
ncbi:hypothetical protein [Encephalitozoon cuniculi GB-M1]|uniref:Uncharacterized protein n=2 Tax=Encephalitozoon cuniculi TaxID=6035 RepID=Q8SW40_ENCCU|nr:uncharacterized protein ECU03_0830 [Encephalitozoon cuniculi GB-M1]AGE95965.1 hypothetical protein ECU03_0830 [Encephalitozoon cuniculi]KMV66445.1 hypothetical protein M970_030750 [Encephalitozoon cuniculi EcunIII-L]UYI28073.1 DUF5092 domain-containing protein [Encephalitozoon cuniculi]CAD26227.1 hypothetical protein [Encephalitozoon cuniculi GB-M1]